MPPPFFGQLVHVAPWNFVGRPNSEGGNGYVEKDHPDGTQDGEAKGLTGVDWHGHRTRVAIILIMALCVRIVTFYYKIK